MGRHDDGLRPATVEELAAAERAGRPSRWEAAKRPVVIVAAASVLLAAGAATIALVRSDGRQPTFEAPYGAAAPFGVGYVDGFGEHTPKPPPSSTPARRPTKSSAAAALPAGSGAAPLAGSPSAGTDLTVEQSPPGKEPVVSGLSAVYWVTTWKNSYEIYIWVHNDGPDTTKWQLEIQLPPESTVTRYWEADGVAAGPRTWRFTPPDGTGLGPGVTYLFAFEGRSDTGAFRVSSCNVNGSPCTQFQ